MQVESIHYQSLKGERKSATLSMFPDRCPLCGKGIHVKDLAAFQTSDEIRRHTIVVIFQCPLRKCRGVFLASYSEIGRFDECYDLNRCYFKEFVEIPAIPESVKNISRQFITTYAQALIAEENGLDQICGPGYRRALEFLVKDFLIAQSDNADDHDRIKKSRLSECIKGIEDENIRTTASRAAWLGNDETHYLRTWLDKDVENLKDLVQLTVNWIDSFERTQRYRNEMP